MRVFGLFFISLLLLLSSCRNLVKQYDNRIESVYKRNSFTSEVLNKNGHQIFYFDNKRENAPVLMLIHGFGGDGKLSWKDQIKAFQDDYRVIVPDILWFGKSKSEQAPNLVSQIDAIQTLINSLSLKNVHLVGISYGGFISLGVAQEEESRLASLTIVDSPGVHFTDQELKEFCDKIGVNSITEAFVPENSEEVQRMMDFSFYNPPFLTSTMREQAIGIYVSKNPEEQKKLLEDLPSNRASFQELNIEIPVLILWGEEDEIFLVEDAYQLQKQLDAKLKVIPGAGHSLPVEEPDEFNKALQDFISKIQ